jgi:hypothetical protein
MALDGGNLLTNGQGLCIATTQLLEMNRDFGYDEHHVAKTIKRLSGAARTTTSVSRLNSAPP